MTTFRKGMKTLTFQIPAARPDINKGSFFPQTVRDWNALPDSVITSVEGAEDGVARFTSLVARFTSLARD